MRLAVIAAVVFIVSASLAQASDEALPFPEDVIMLKGADLAPVSGVSISMLNLIVFRDGEFISAPFQVDEVREGEHVFDWVSEEGRKIGLHDRDVDGGRLDDNDEVLFMGRDLGEKAENLSVLSAETVVEIVVSDKGKGLSGYAYIVSSSNWDTSEKDYVEMKIREGRLYIETERYSFSGLADRGFFDTLRMRKADGSFTKDITVRNGTPARLELRFIGLGGTLDFYDLIRGTTVATKDGSIRALWRCTGAADFGVFKIKGEGATEQHYYMNRMDQPVTMDIPFNFASVLDRFAIRGTMVYEDAALPVTYYGPDFREGVKITGQSEEGEPIIGEVKRDWCAVDAGGATYYFLVFFSDEWTPVLDRTAYIHDGPESGEAGTYFGNMVDLLTKGLHQYMIRYYIVPYGFEWGDEDKIPEIRGRELTVSSRHVH